MFINQDVSEIKKFRRLWLMKYSTKKDVAQKAICEKEDNGRGTESTHGEKRPILRQFRLKEILDTESYTVTLTPGEFKELSPRESEDESFEDGVSYSVNVAHKGSGYVPGLSIHRNGEFYCGRPWAGKRYNQEIVRENLIETLAGKRT